MEITTVQPFLKYWSRIRGRTTRIIGAIPEGKIDWRYLPGKFSFADQIRHLATIERYMYAENAQFLPSTYPGCGPELAEGHTAVLQYLEDRHAESMEIFGQLTDEDLQRKTMTPGGAELRLGNWLRAMVEHEVHHRSHIYLMLSMLGVATPPLYGLTAEEVEAASRG